MAHQYNMQHLSSFLPEYTLIHIPGVLIPTEALSKSLEELPGQAGLQLSVHAERRRELTCVEKLANLEKCVNGMKY